MDKMIDLIKVQILTYAVEKRTIKGLSEITKSVTIIMANTLNISPKRTHRTAVKMVRLALAELERDMLSDAVDTLEGICNGERKSL